MKTHQNLRDGKWSVEMEVTGNGEPLLFIHGAGGLTGADPFLEDLGQSFKVYAPHLPGYGESSGADIDDVIDAALFYHELMDELGIPTANIVGHSMGGMLAAEVAALDTRRAKKLVLVAPAGFWIDAHPIPDFFSAELNDLPALLFHDPTSQLAQMMVELPWDNQELLTAMYVERTKRFSTASKFLWPIPDRGLKKRAYRIAAPTLLVWGESDRTVPPVYAGEFQNRIRNCRLQTIKEAGHMVMYEQPAEFCRVVTEFLRG
jgi:pimeloyl-ACP methyl ester carboxylesterase